MLIVIVSLISGGFIAPIHAQDDPVYRFIARIPGYVYVLRCEAGICAPESTIIDAMDFRALSLSGDGTQLAGVWYQMDMDIVIKIVKLDGTPIAEHLLNPGDPMLRGRPSYSAWSPDGQWLQLSGTPGTGHDCFIDLSALRGDDVASCEYFSSLPDHRPVMRRARWSPDGAYLMFVTADSYWSAALQFSRDALLVMNINHVRNYERSHLLAITPSILGECRTFDWLNDREILFRCYGFPDPVDYPNPVPPVWYIAHVETGEINRADVPSELLESGGIAAQVDSPLVAFIDYEVPQISVWNRDTQIVEHFTVSPELDELQGRVLWFPY